jgi:ribonuclease Z
LLTLAYSLTEKDRPGRFDGALAEKLGIPHGPERGRLKKGEDVTLADGRLIHSRDLVAPPLPGRKIVYITDTTYCRGSVNLARKADLLIHESTYDQEDRENARRTFHSTVADAVRVAREAEVKQLLLTHISSRYLRNSRIIEQQVRRLFPNSFVARDFLQATLNQWGEITYRWPQQSRNDNSGKTAKEAVK